MGKPDPNQVISMPNANKWSVAEDLIMIPNPTKNDNLFGLDGFTEKFYNEHAQNIEEVRHAFSLVGEDTLESLVMIDTLQRLGIDYHFKEEIKSVLEKQYVKCIDQGHGLYEVALRFRLMRQGSYNVSEDMFTQFMSKEGKFKLELTEDIKGLTSLYEASHLIMGEETILSDAKDYTEHILNDFAARQSHPQARLVENTLSHPQHKSLARFNVKNFIKYYKGESQTRDVIHELAKMDFSIVQSIHQNEVLQVSKWWNELGLSKELKFARNQPIKWYMWPMAMLEDPSLSEQRVDLTKPISLVYIIDDIFDVYGTIDQMSLFTEVVNSWDYAGAEQLPDYMKACFKALNDITNEIGYKIMKKHEWNPIDTLRKSWATLCNAFLVEAKWFASGHSPKAEEYLKNGIVSTGVHVILVHLFFLLGENINTTSVELLNDSFPCIIESTAKILRLWDDLGSAKDENQEGQDGSYLDCYMKEHEGLSIESVKEHVTIMISNTWKSLNRESLSANPFSASFSKCTLNAARMIPLMYSYDDNHCLPQLKEQLKSMLCDV